MHSNCRVYIISLRNETGGKCGLSDTGGELSSVMSSRWSRLILVLVQSRRTCEPMRDRGNGLACLGTTLWCKHTAYGHMVGAEGGV